jgi:CO/xanthine dehydrogenase Mo-binding subunit
VAAAFANAVADAIGVRIYDLPVTAEKIIRALGKI